VSWISQIRKLDCFLYLDLEVCWRKSTLLKCISWGLYSGSLVW
jgi:hypothetical protein